MQTPPRPAPRSRRRLRVRALVLLCVLGACVALAACGSSGSSTSASTTIGTSTSGGKAASGSSRFTALRSCLQKQGITLPAPPSGATGAPGGGGGPGGPGGGRGLQPPEGVSQAKFQEALKKCGAGNRPGGGTAANLNSATARAALDTYAACMRTNGINVPAPNTSGSGPIFNTNGINTSSTQFKTAQSKCQSDLKGVFPGGGAGGPPPSAGA
ncbi:MAG: hypothetical protein QOF54_1758 [Solirubrobacteraceae bacterium]|nr:hypothetical protein [Solirubrobacteraceae bacterium]